MDDDIARVDQHPVADILAFDLGNDAEFGFQPVGQFFRDGPDLPGRPAGCDDHMVGHFGFAAQVDLHDIFSLVIVEGLQDRGKQLIADARFRARHQARTGCSRRGRMGVK